MTDMSGVCSSDGQLTFSKVKNKLVVCTRGSDISAEKKGCFRTSALAWMWTAHQHAQDPSSVNASAQFMLGVQTLHYLGLAVALRELRSLGLCSRIRGVDCSAVTETKSSCL